MTQIVMPYMTEGIAKHVPEYEAWRWAYFLPGCLFIIICFLILVLGQVSHTPSSWPCALDLPDSRCLCKTWGSELLQLL